MNLISAFEKLIVEHGSSKILREHLSLLRDQVVALEKRAVASEKRASDLENQYSDCQLHVKHLEKDNHELRQEIQKYKQTANYSMKLGCLVFHGDDNLYCPKCYFDGSRKIPTSRKSSKLRFCSVCRTDIPAG